MICPKCGCQLNDDAQFCIYCGCRITPKAAPATKKSNSNGLIAIIIVVAILLLAGLGAVYYFLLMDRPADGHDDGIRDMLPMETLEHGGNTVPTGAETTPQETEAEESSNSKEETQAQEDQVTTSANAGIPKLDYSDEVLRRTYDLYWDEINRDPDAMGYSLLNMFGDEIPELILKSKDSKGQGQYRIYFIMDGQLLPIQKATVTAGTEDVLYGNNGTLIVVHNAMLATSAAIDLSLNLKSETLILEGELEYTDNVLTCDADEDGLLNLILFGSDKKMSYSGWVRHKGLDYYYVSGACVINHWYREGDVLTYVCSEGYAAYTATESELQKLMDEYCQGFIDACHEQDVALLKHATDGNRKDMKKHLSEEWNRDRTFFGFVSSPSIAKLDHNTGNIILNMNVIWSLDDDGKDTTDDTVYGYYVITLINQDNQWLIDLVEYV